MKRRFLAAILTLGMIVSLIPATAQATTGETFVATTYFTIINTRNELTLVFKVLTEDTASGTGTVQVGTGGDGNYTAIPEGVNISPHLVIPKTVTHNGIEYAVTTIGKNAFAGCTSLQYIAMFTITEICDNAFTGCTNLKYVDCTMLKAPILGSSVFPGQTKLGVPNIATGYAPAYGWPDKPSENPPMYWGEHYGWILPSIISATPDSSNKIYYSIYEGEAILSGIYDVNELYIPSEFKGFPITGIIMGSGVYLPGGLKLVIPDTIKTIADIGGLGTITSEEQIELTGDNPSFVVENGVLYNKEKTELIKYFKTNTAESYTVPDTVTTIDGHAFFECDNLKNITIHDNVNFIGDYAFTRCYGLTDLRLPDSLKFLGMHAFADTTLSNLSIPGDINTIAGLSFYQASEKISKLTIRNGKPLRYRNIPSIATTYTNFNTIKGYKNLIIDEAFTSVGKIYCQYLSPLHQYAIAKSINYILFDVVPTVNEYSDLLDVEVISDTDIMVTAKCKQGKSFDLSKLMLYKAEYTDDGRLYGVELATTEMSVDGTLTLTVSHPKSPLYPCKLILLDKAMRPVSKTMNGVYVGTYLDDTTKPSGSDKLTYIWEFE